MIGHTEDDRWLQKQVDNGPVKCRSGQASQYQYANRSMHDGDRHRTHLARSQRLRQWLGVQIDEAVVGLLAGGGQADEIPDSTCPARVRLPQVSLRAMTAGRDDRQAPGPHPNTRGSRRPQCVQPMRAADEAKRGQLASQLSNGMTTGRSGGGFRSMSSRAFGGP